MDGSSSFRDVTNGNPEDQPDSLPLKFLNFSHPSQVKGSKSRKAVRSHVTRVQHEQTRARKFVKIGNAAPERVPAQRKHESGDEAVHDAVPAAAPHSNEDDDADAEEIPRFPRQVAMSRVNPFTAYDPGLDWRVDVPSLIDQYLNKARSQMVLRGMSKEARALHSRLVQPRLYLDGFLFNALITLTTTSVPVLNEQKRPEPLIAWLRTNFLITVQAAVKAGSYDPKALAIGIALLVGWEMDVGDPNLCQVHLKALPSIIESESDQKLRLASFAYRDQGNEGVFRGGKTIPSGFEFYRSQNLLPPTLMFLVGSLIYWGSPAPGASLWMRELWSSIGACAPLDTDAQKSLAQRTVASRVAQLVRQAGIMLGSFMRASAGERPVAQPLITSIRVLWHSTLSDDWDSLIGTVYDTVLLWCLCVFCTTSGYRNDHHLKAIRELLVQLSIRSTPRLSALLATFVWPSCVQQPLDELCSHDLFPPTRGHG